MSKLVAQSSFLVGTLNRGIDGHPFPILLLSRVTQHWAPGTNTGRVLCIGVNACLKLSNGHFTSLLLEGLVCHSLGGGREGLRAPALDEFVD